MNKPLASPELLLVRQLLTNHQSQPGGLLPLLHAVQDALGFIPANAVPLIAEGMHLSRAEVHGVITYYHFFRSTPPGQHVVQVCRAEACRACGSEELWAQAQSLLGCGAHETSADGKFSLEPVYCLGLCASSPAVQIDDKLHVRMTEAKFSAVVAKLGSAA
jgi:formate dehydrogenase subunit gamma